ITFADVGIETFALTHRTSELSVSVAQLDPSDEQLESLSESRMLNARSGEGSLAQRVVGEQHGTRAAGQAWVDFVDHELEVLVFVFGGERLHIVDARERAKRVGHGQELEPPLQVNPNVVDVDRGAAS